MRRLNITQYQLECIMCLADMFGFRPEGPSWQIPESLYREIVEYEHIAKPEQLGWFTVFRTVRCVDSADARDMARALRRASQWLEAKPTEFPSWFDQSSRTWIWYAIWEWINRPDFPKALEKVTAFLEQGSFKFLPFGYGAFMAALVDCEHPPIPEHSTQPDLEDPPDFMKHQELDSDPKLPGFDEP